MCALKLFAFSAVLLEANPKAEVGFPRNRVTLVIPRNIKYARLFLRGGGGVGVEWWGGRGE